MLLSGYVGYQIIIKGINQRCMFLVYQKNTHLKPSRHHQKTSEILLFRREHHARSGHLWFCVAKSWKFPRTETPQSHRDPILLLHYTLSNLFFFWCTVWASQAVSCDNCSLCHYWIFSHFSIPHPAWGAHLGWPLHPVQNWGNNSPLCPSSRSGCADFSAPAHHELICNPISWDSQVICNKCVHPLVK